MDLICTKIHQGLTDIWHGFLVALYFLSMTADDPWKWFVCVCVCGEGAYMLSLGSRPSYAGQGGCDLNGALIFKHRLLRERDCK